MNGSGASKSFRGTLSEAEAIKRLQRFLQCLLARQMLKNRRLRRQLRQCWNLGKLFQAYSEAGVNHDRAMAAFLLQRPGSPDSPTKHRMGSEALARRQIDSILASEARVGEYESSRMPSDAQVLQGTENLLCPVPLPFLPSCFVLCVNPPCTTPLGSGAVAAAALQLLQNAGLGPILQGKLAAVPGAG